MIGFISVIFIVPIKDFCCALFFCCCFHHHSLIHHLKLRVQSRLQSLHTPCSDEILVYCSCFHYVVNTPQLPKSRHCCICHAWWIPSGETLPQNNWLHWWPNTWALLHVSSEGKNWLLPHPQQNILLHHYTTVVVFFTAISMICAKHGYSRHIDAGWVGDDSLDSVGEHVRWVVVGSVDEHVGLIIVGPVLVVNMACMTHHLKALVEPDWCAHRLMWIMMKNNYPIYMENACTQAVNIAQQIW